MLIYLKNACFLSFLPIRAQLDLLTVDLKVFRWRPTELAQTAAGPLRLRPTLLPMQQAVAAKTMSWAKWNVDEHGVAKLVIRCATT